MTFSFQFITYWHCSPTRPPQEDKTHPVGRGQRTGRCCRATKSDVCMYTSGTHPRSCRSCLLILDPLVAAGIKHTRRWENKHEADDYEYSLKWKMHHVDEFAITGCTGSCHMTTSGDASDGKFVNVTNFLFQCCIPLSKIFEPLTQARIRVQKC